MSLKFFFNDIFIQGADGAPGADDSKQADDVEDVDFEEVK